MGHLKTIRGDWKRQGGRHLKPQFDSEKGNMKFERGNTDCLTSLNIGRITLSAIVISIYIHSTHNVSASSYLDTKRLSNEKTIKILSNLNKYKITGTKIFLQFDDGFYTLDSIKNHFNTKKIKYFYFDGEFYDIPFNNLDSEFKDFTMFKRLKP
jgi:hypothetical protein